MDNLARSRRGETAQPAGPDGFELDIPMDIARSAHANRIGGEEMAEAELRAYAATLAADFAAVRRSAGGATDVAERLLAEYRAGYRVRVMALLIAMAHRTRTYVGGPSRYPRSVSGDATVRRDEVAAFRAIKLAAVRRAVARASTRPTEAVSSRAEIEAELAELEAEFQRMKRVNELVRPPPGMSRAVAARDLDPSELVAAAVRLGVDEGEALRIMTPDESGWVGYRELQMKNKYSAIARCRKRLSDARGTPATVSDVVITGESGTIRIAGSEVALYLNGCTDKGTRRRLSGAGFAYRSGAWRGAAEAVDVARSVAGVTT